MKFSTLEELKVRQWDVFGRLFESVRRQVGQNWPVQDFRGLIFSVPKTLPDNLIQRGVRAGAMARPPTGIAEPRGARPSSGPEDRRSVPAPPRQAQQGRTRPQTPRPAAPPRGPGW